MGCGWIARTNLMMIRGVLFFDRRIRLARLKRVVEKRSLVFRRCRQRVVEPGSIAMGVSMLSYNEAVQFGLVTDHGLCPAPEKIIERCANGFEKVVLTTLMSPWLREQPLHDEVTQSARAVA